MRLVVVTAAKGSPGVTTTALALAATWPSTRGPLLLECDPSGGDLGAMFSLGDGSGLVSLAAAARRATNREDLCDLVAAHARELPGGLRVVPAPVRADAAVGAVDVLAASPALRTTASSASKAPAPEAEPAVDPAPILLDAGRLPARPGRGDGHAALLAAADLVLLVVRNDVRGLLHATASLDGLLDTIGKASAQVRRPEEARVRAVVVGQGYSLEEVSQALAIPTAGRLPIDDRAAAALSGRPVRRPGTVNRAPLLRAAARITRTLAASLAPERSDGGTGGDGSPTATTDAASTMPGRAKEAS